MNKVAPILIVDDDVEEHVILEDYFSDIDLKHHVQFVMNGQMAIDLLDDTPDENLPKLIVLDLNMPILSGIQTLLHLKKSRRFKNIPVIIYSTSENDGEKRKCINYGALDYLIKPSSYESGMKIVQYMKSLVDTA